MNRLELMELGGLEIVARRLSKNEPSFSVKERLSGMGRLMGFELEVYHSQGVDGESVLQEDAAFLEQAPKNILNLIEQVDELTKENKKLKSYLNTLGKVGS